MPCRGVMLTLVLLLVPTTRGTCQEPQKPIPPWERRDILGRPIPWGKEVGGQRVCLWMPYTRLLYGQPIDLVLQTAQATEQPPHIRLDWEGPRRSIYVEWTTDSGEPVTFSRWGDGYSSGGGGNEAGFRLKPTGKFARGQYLVAGKYRIRAVIDSKRVPADPIRWVGRAESNMIEFVVFDSDENGRTQLVPDAIREKAAAFVQMLDDPEFSKRDRAEQGLLEVGFEILPLLEPALESPSVEARLRAWRIFKKLTAPLFEDRTPIRFYRTNEAAALLAPLGDATWKALHEQQGREYVQWLRNWRVEAALSGAVRYVPEGDPLPAETVRALVADLNDKEPHIRAAAVRTVPRTRNAEVLTALAARIADSHEVWHHGAGDPFPVWPIADDAGWQAIPYQGTAIIEPLVAFARKENDGWIRRRIFMVLGMIGPDPRSSAYLRERIAARDPNDYFSAVESLAKLGPETVPDLIKLAEAGVQTGQNPNLPRIALEQLVHHGNAKSVGSVLLKMLRHPNWEMPWAAIPVIEKIGLREALPELKRLAQQDRSKEGEHPIGQNVTMAAIGAYARMADRKDAAEFLLDRLASEESSTRGQAVYMLAAIEWREAVPRILKLLSDSDWYVRAQADHALRGLSQRPEGVGYDAYKPNPALWRNWWKQKQ